MLETLVVVVVLVAVAYWAFGEGKREGSHKGFHAGRRRRRR